MSGRPSSWPAAEQHIRPTIAEGEPDDASSDAGDRALLRGVRPARWDRGSFTLFQVHDDLAVVKTVLTREAADRRPIKAWNCSYTMRLVEKNWLFTLITPDDTGDDQAGLRPAST